MIHDSEDSKPESRNKKEFLQEEGKSFLQHDEVRRNLHACSCHLQSKSCKKTLFVVYLSSSKDLISTMHPCQTA